MSVGRIWDKFLTERDRQVFAAFGYGTRSGFGERPGLLIVDVSYGFTGYRPEPILDSIKRWCNSCGFAGNLHDRVRSSRQLGRRQLGLEKCTFGRIDGAGLALDPNQILFQAILMPLHKAAGREALGCSLGISGNPSSARFDRSD